jgi:amidase
VPPPGRSQGACRSAPREGLVVPPPGRSQGACRSAPREGYRMIRDATIVEVDADLDLALKVDGLTAGYGPMTVLNDLSLQVGHGEIVGVLGANGMGKSTLMKTLAGVIAARGGTVLTNGEPIEKLAAHERARRGIAYVQQGRGILGALTTRENLRIAWSSELGESEDMAVARVLKLFPRLHPLLERRGGALSGGEQQLLALARALVSQPWLLLLDEPTEGIQPSIIDEIAQTLVHLRDQEGLSILVAEQNLDFILDCSDRVLILEKGAIVNTLSAAQLREPAQLDKLLGWGAARSTRGAPGAQGDAARAPLATLVTAVAAIPISTSTPIPTQTPSSPLASHATTAHGHFAAAAARPRAPHPTKEYTMAIRRPTLEQLRLLTADLHMHLSEPELAQYLEQMEGSFAAYDRIDQLPDFLPEVVYPRTPGRRPSADENKLNAWYVKTDIRGAASGPLRGRKVVLKDNIALAGVPMMNGSSTLEGFVPEIDATVARRVLDAGGTIAGKAHCEFFCLSGGSHTNATGPVHNPWRKGYIAGGSSSGCGALVGSGELQLAIGGDQGGSVRIPAAFSGCYGMKGTHGLVPYTGAMPIEATIDHLGPITGSVADNALLLEVIAGEDGLDPRQYAPRTARYTEALDKGVDGLRIGLVTEGFGLAGATPGLDEKVRAAADRLRGLGARVEVVSVPMHADGLAIWTPIALEGLQAQMMHGNGMGFNWRGLYQTSLIDRHAGWRDRADELSPSLKVSMFVGEWFLQHHRGRYYAKAQNLSRRLRLAYDDALARYDLLVMPTVQMTAQPIPQPDAPVSEVIQRAFEMVANTAPFDATGHPAMSVPCGLLGGLPVGLMLIARHWEEATIYRAASALEKSGDWRSW